MEKSNVESIEEDGNNVITVDYNTTLDFHVNKDIPKWAIMASDISCHNMVSQSMPSDNVNSVELVNVISVNQRSDSRNNTNLSTSSSSLSAEHDMHQRKGDKNDASTNQKSSSLPTLNQQNNALCDDTSIPDIDETIFSNIRGKQKVEDGNEQQPRKELSIRMALVLILLIFSVCLGALAFVYSSFPKMEESESKALKFPSNIDDAKLLGQGMCLNQLYTLRYVPVRPLYIVLCL